MINDVKTDFLIIGTRQQLEKTSIKSIIIGDTVIKPLESVWNLGSWFDAHMRMNVHIGKICSKAFRGLYNIREIRKFLTVQSTKTLIHAFVSSHLDYCNALLFRGGSRIFFRRGCTRLLLYFNTNKPHSFFFFLQNTSCIRKPQVISGRGGGGGCAPPAPSP